MSFDDTLPPVPAELTHSGTHVINQANTAQGAPFGSADSQQGRGYYNLVDVLEDAEADEKAARRSGVIVWIAVIVLVFLVWSSLATLEQVTRGPGQVITRSKTHTLQAPDGGVMGELNVKEGDLVTRGQVLARLDHARAQASLLEMQARYVSVRAVVARLRAEVRGGSLQFPKEVDNFPEVAASQRLLFAKRQAALHDELSSLDESLELARKEYLMHKTLLTTGDTSQAEVLRLQRQMHEISAGIHNRKNKYIQEAQAELAKSEEELAALQASVKQRETSLAYTVLTAPVSGTVKNIKFTTPGAVLRAGEELLTIVPLDDQLIVEAKIKPADIAYVKVGMPANVKLDAYDFTVYGALKGEVVYVSADTIIEDGKPAEGNAFYRVHVRTQARTLAGKNGQQLPLLPGMTGTVEVKSGSNTVLKYLLKPLVKTFDTALTEH